MKSRSGPRGQPRAEKETGLPAYGTPAVAPSAAGLPAPPPSPSPLRGATGPGYARLEVTDRRATPSPGNPPRAVDASLKERKAQRTPSFSSYKDRERLFAASPERRTHNLYLRRPTSKSELNGVAADVSKIPEAGAPRLRRDVAWWARLPSRPTAAPLLSPPRAPPSASPNGLQDAHARPSTEGGQGEPQLHPGSNLWLFGVLG